MTREGRASSTRSKKSSSMPAALREKIEKLAPPCTSVAPNGKLRPFDRTAIGFSITTCSSYVITVLVRILFRLAQQLESIPSAVRNLRERGLDMENQASVAVTGAELFAMKPKWNA